MSINEDIYNKIPTELEDHISSESIEFAVKSERLKPLSKTLPGLIFGIIWTVISSSIAFLILAGYIVSKSFNKFFKGMNDIKPKFNIGMEEAFVLFSIIFVIIGISVVVSGIYSVFRGGRLFIGTPRRLIVYKRGLIRTIKWEQFTGEITVKGKSTKGDIFLTMRTGEYITDDGLKSFVPEVIYMVGVPNPYDIERICRKRIQENDSTIIDKFIIT